MRVQARQTQPGAGQDGGRSSRVSGGDAEAIDALASRWRQADADAGTRRRVGGETREPSHLLGTVGDDRRALAQRLAQIVDGFVWAVEHDLAAGDPPTTRGAVLEARSHLGPHPGAVQSGDDPHQRVALHRVPDRDLGSPRGTERVRLGGQARAVEDVQRRAEALRQVGGVAGRARVDLPDHVSAGSWSRFHTRRATRRTSSRCG